MSELIMIQQEQSVTANDLIKVMMTSEAATGGTVWD